MESVEFGHFPGAALVFTRSKTTWSQQGSKLTASDENPPGDFGYSVSLSSDGTIGLIGGPRDDVVLGAA